ncbi:MAG TPA: PEP-CTERM sorting domain-containing protein [Phycisphaerae bacterium]|nr:PEP-CTERM sorting domain-containing protein [Phycisphaerae bacterium]HDZ42469.1 PEP-CTERM sorting domain-containing protein [Phycisphaerae bacterium]
MVSLRMTATCASKTSRWAAMAWVCCLLMAAPATALVVEDHGPFSVSFYGAGDGGSDTGVVGDQDWTLQQRQDVAASVDIWASHITDTPGRQIQLHVFWSELDSYGTNVLGGSASRRTWDGNTIWNAGEYVWREGVNYASSVNFDTFVQLDITAAGVGGGWNFGSGNPAGNAIDFRSVISHELGHSLGFSDSYDASRKDFGWVGPPVRYAGLTEWDKFLIDSDGTTAPAGGGRARDFNATDDPVFWTGPLANDYYGQPVPIYAPDPFAQGSSMAHVDQASLSYALMSPWISTGQSLRDPIGVEWKMMQDMGWSVVFALGDFDEDGDIDSDDINLLCDNVGDPAFDVDGDNDADEDDLIYLVENLVELSDGSGRVGTQRGDFNLDGVVNATDLAIMKDTFGASGVGYAGGNANCDTVVNATDLAILKANFGFSAPTGGGVPEPATLGLLALASFALLKRQRRQLADRR